MKLQNKRWLSISNTWDYGQFKQYVHYEKIYHLIQDHQLLVISINYLSFEFHLVHAKADDVNYDDVSKRLSFTIVKVLFKIRAAVFYQI